MNLENRGVSARMPFKKLQASFQKPEIKEGFAEIIDVDFEVSILGSSEVCVLC
jgi:hypothetical protein